MRNGKGSGTLQSGGSIGGARQSLANMWKAKGNFMLMTFALLILELALTFVMMYKLADSETFDAFAKKHQWLLIVTSLLSLVIIIVIAFVPMNMYLKMLMFTLFSVCTGVMLALVKKHVPESIIRAALASAIGVFVALFIVGVLLTRLGYDMWWLGILLLVALLGLIITGIVFMFIEPSKKAVRIRAGVAIAVFALFVMFDTNQILQRNYSGDYVTAAIDYYLDIINLFIHFIEAMGSD